MKKILMMLLITLSISIISSTVVFAEKLQSVQDIQRKLLELGVPNTYVGNIIEYLQKIEISEEQYNKIKAKFDQAEVVLNGEVDISAIDEERKSVLKELALESAAVIGVRVVFGKDSNGVTTVKFLDSNNSNIASLTTMDVIEVALNLDLNWVHETIKAMVEFANSSEKDKFEPIKGEFNNTGTNVGNTIMLGLGLIMLSGITFITAKKVFV